MSISSKFTTDVMLAAQGRSSASPFRAARKRCLDVIVSMVISITPRFWRCVVQPILAELSQGAQGTLKTLAFHGVVQETHRSLS